MMFHIPKITIYRIDSFKPEAPTQLQISLKIANPNMSAAQVKFRSLTAQEKMQVDPKNKILGKIELPIDDVIIEPSSQYIDPTA